MKLGIGLTYSILIPHQDVIPLATVQGSAIVVVILLHRMCLILDAPLTSTHVRLTNLTFPIQSIII